jgi:toxin YoeB
MVTPWKVVFTKQAQKDAKKISASHLRDKVESLLELIQKDPYGSPPGYEKLIGDLSGFLSRRINIQHRLVYEVYETERTIKVVRMWTHYE